MNLQQILQQEGEEFVKEFCRNTPRIRQESGLTFARRLESSSKDFSLRVAKGVLQRVREEIGEELDVSMFNFLQLTPEDRDSYFKILGTNKKTRELILACDTIERELEGNQGNI